MGELLLEFVKNLLSKAFKQYGTPKTI